MKEYNLKRHYKTKHAAKFAAIQDQLRSDEVADMKKNCSANNLHLIKKQNVKSELSVKDSCMVSDKIASKYFSFFFSDEFINECMNAAT